MNKRNEGKMIRGFKARRAGGFTLLELLVVMAITTILLGLLFGPIIQAFNLTRRSRAIAGAQDAARFGLEKIVRELAQASYVYDNTNTPLLLPIGPKHLTPNDTTTVALPYLFAKIDFVPSATHAPAAGDIVDPTTGGPIKGAKLQFPLAPGQRVVRYWIGLRNNLLPDGNAARYQNVYEFPRADNDFNPFILWRAEFDPDDANVINQDPAKKFSIAADDGGFNDPDFFYNTKTAGPGSNGGTYAANWRAIASPMLSVDKVDLIAWNRGSDRNVSATDPLRPTVSFSPATVVGDTAAPGYLDDLGNETPNAVPSVYTAKHGQWVLPYAVTFYRSTTHQNGDPPNYVRVQVSTKADGTIGIAPVSGGTLATLDVAPEFVSSVSRHGIFIKTKEVTFQIDPLRGRIRTGFPPVAGDSAGGPKFDTDPNSATFGEPIVTVFHLSTLNPLAGQLVPVPPGGPVAYYPLNAGITEAVLKDQHYFAAGDAVTAYASPFSVFGAGLVIPGSERVLGPDNAGRLPDTAGGAPPRADLLVPYHRVPVLALLSKQSSTIVPVNPNSPDPRFTVFTGDPPGPLNYKLDVDLDPLNPRVVFDDTTASSTPPQGLPTARRNPNDLLQTIEPEKEVQITYLWQNNYARNPAGMPINANGNPVAGTANAPEADVVKVDYSTRSLLNINLGVRVYDPSSGQPQLVQVTDRVKINNPGR